VTLDPVKILFIAQFIVQAVLLGVVVYLIVIDKKRKIPTEAFDELMGLVEQTRKLSEDFREQTQSNVELVNRVMKDLDSRVQQAKLVIDGMEKTSVHAKETRKFSSEDVIRLFKGGFDPVDISQISGIPVGEIQLMIKITPDT